MRCMLFSLVLSLTIAGAAQAQSYDSKRATVGELSFTLSCAVCHGAEGKGDGTLASSLVVPAPDLTTLRARHGGVFPEDYVVTVINGGAGVTEHGGQMPAWGLLFLKDIGDSADAAPAYNADLVQRRIGDLVEYLKKIQQP